MIISDAHSQEGRVEKKTNLISNTDVWQKFWKNESDVRCLLAHLELFTAIKCNFVKYEKIKVYLDMYNDIRYQMANHEMY